MPLAEISRALRVDRMQSPVVREHAGIADDQIIRKSIALGWPGFLASRRTRWSPNESR